MNAEDVVASVSSWINRASLDFGLPPERAAVILVKTSASVPTPNWALKVLPSREMFFSRFVTHDITRIRLEFVSKDAALCLRLVGFIQNRLKNNYYKLPGILQDFHYPEPLVELSAGGSLPVGQYFVGVTGIGFIDESESLLSEVLPVTVDGTQDIRLWIPKYPEGIDHFDQYNVYLGTTEDALYKTDNSPYFGHPNLPTSVTLSSLPSGTVGPPTQSTVKFEIISVESFDYLLTDDRREPENVILAINMEIRSRRYLVREPRRPIEEIVAQVETI